MAYIEIAGIPHYYEWLGQEGTDGPSGDRPVMVFVHGWGGSARYWESTARSLSDCYDCLLYDMRGFGRSSARSLRVANDYDNPRDEIYALERYAEELIGVLDSFKLDRVSLQSHSMGSSVAALAASWAPERVERAVLACSGIFEFDRLTFQLFHQIGGVVVRFRPGWLPKIPGMDRMMINRFVHRMLPAPERQAFLEDYMQADMSANLGTMYTCVSEHASIAMPEAFSKITCPTLMISGEKDIIIPSELGRQAAALNEVITHKELPGVAHLPMLEDREAYVGAVRDFLQCDRVPATQQ